MTDEACKPVRILLLEDSDFDAELITSFVQQVKPEPEIIRAVGRKDYIQALESGGYDIILSDYSLPDFDGLAALDLAIEKAPDTPFIFVSGVLGEEIAIETFKKGATDYVLKQRLLRLPAALERAIAESREKAERAQAEAQLKLLVAELSHRVKNTLAMVMSIVRRTAPRSATLGEYERSLTSRLRALSDAHELLFESNWRETTMEQLLQKALHPFRLADGDYVNLSGPDVALRPKAAVALSLIFHELLTNALKFGALSSDAGKVEIEWQIKAQDTKPLINFTWKEIGGPKVSEPAAPGFGTSLILRSVEYELDGVAKILYLPSGVTCELQFSGG